MTGAQLRHIRASRDWTLRQMADAIGDVSFSTLGRWENEPDTVLPSWVEERLFRTTPITLPLEDLHTLLDASRDEGVPFESVLNEALRLYVKERRSQPDADTANEPDKPVPDNVTPMTPLYETTPAADPASTSRVAEPPADG